METFARKKLIVAQENHIIKYLRDSCQHMEHGADTQVAQRSAKARHSRRLAAFKHIVEARGLGG